MSSVLNGTTYIKWGGNTGVRMATVAIRAVYRREEPRRDRRSRHTLATGGCRLFLVNAGRNANVRWCTTERSEHVGPTIWARVRVADEWAPVSTNDCNKRRPSCTNDDHERYCFEWDQCRSQLGWVPGQSRRRRPNTMLGWALVLDVVTGSRRQLYPEIMIVKYEMNLRAYLQR